MIAEVTPSIWILGSPFLNDTGKTVKMLQGRGWHVVHESSLINDSLATKPNPCIVIIDESLGHDAIGTILTYRRLFNRQPEIFLVKNGMDLATNGIRVLDINSGLEQMLGEIFSTIDLGDKLNRNLLDIAESFTIVINTTAGDLLKRGYPSIVFSELLSSGKLSLDEAIKMQIGFEEAMINAVDHGCLELQSRWREILDGQGNALYDDERARRATEMKYNRKKIKIKADVCSKKISISITDSGKGFAHDSNYTEGNECALWGRGISMINSYFDEVKHNERGNRVTMVKYFEVRPQ